MTMTMGEISELLRSTLGLTEPPVQISYLDEEPKDIASYAGTVPSGCTYWSAGTVGAFYARLADHFNCEIGAYVLGTKPEGELGGRLMETVGLMEKEGYLAKGEAFSIPRFETAPRFVCYGPLGSMRYAPDAVVMFVEPSAAMLCLESAEKGGAHPYHVPVTGRPTCSLIPHLLNNGENAGMSFGCSGFRTFVENAKGKVLFAVRGKSLHDFADRLKRTAGANRLTELRNLEKKKEICG